MTTTGTSTRDTTGDRIMRRRIELGLSMNRLGLEIGGDHSQISLYEANKTMPKGVQAVLLARALKTTVEWLLEPAVNAWLVKNGFEVPA